MKTRKQQNKIRRYQNLRKRSKKVRLKNKAKAKVKQKMKKYKIRIIQRTKVIRLTKVKYKRAEII
jgi:hypothetical protein